MRKKQKNLCNPLIPNINIHLLPAILYMFILWLVGWICVNLKTFHPKWSFTLFSWLAGHYWGLKCNSPITAHAIGCILLSNYLGICILSYFTVLLMLKSGIPIANQIVLKDIPSHLFQFCYGSDYLRIGNFKFSVKKKILTLVCLSPCNIII